MSRIELDKPTHEALVRAVSRYLNQELDAEVSGLQAGLLLDFLAETLGPHYYNRGLADAQALMARKLEEMGDAVFSLEKPVKL